MQLLHGFTHEESRNHSIINMEEHGIVIALKGHQALVRVENTDACRTCSCKGFCMMAGDGSAQILADNSIGAKEKDWVTVALGEGRTIAGTAIVFLTPLLGLFIGLFLGISRYGTAGGVIGAIAGTLVGLGVLWLLDRRLGKGSTFRPRITAINHLFLNTANQS
jgi:positive regulator of sigma E activity